MPRPGRWLTTANGLTLLRLLAALPLALAVLTGASELAAALFALAVATDFADGYAARRLENASARGAFADHAVDAIFVSVGSGALAYAGQLPVALPPLIAVAFAQYALDSRLTTVRGLRPSSLGRWNGIGYYVALGVPVVRDGLGLAWPGAEFVSVLGWLLVATTAASIADRLLISWRALRRPPDSPGAGRAGRWRR